MSTATQNAGRKEEARSTALDPVEFIADFPDHEVFVYRNHTLRSEGFPNGIECLITIPKSKIAGHWLYARATANQRVIEVRTASGRGVTPIIPPKG